MMDKQMRRFSKTLITSSLLLALSACGGKSTEEHVATARQLIDQNQLDTAIIELKNAIRQSPSDGQTRLLLADTYFSMGETAFAEKEYEAALRFGQDANVIKGRLARLLFVQDKFEEVMKLEVEKSLAAEIQSQILVLQALANYRLQDDVVGNELVDKALQVSENSIYSQLGSIVKEASKNPKVAVSELQTLTANNPDLSEAQLYLGFIATTTSQYDVAIQAFKKHIDIFPLAHQVRLFLANVLIRNANFTEAEPEVSKVLKLAKEQPFANQLMATIKFNAQQYDSALSHMEKAIQNGINSESNRLIAGLSAFQLEKYEQSHNHLLSLKDSLDNSHPAKKALAITQLKLGYGNEADSTLSELENLAEEDNQLFAAASYELIKAGELDKASQSLKRLNTSGDDALSLTQAGILKLSLNELDGIANLEKAIAIDSDLPIAKVALASAYIQSQQFNKALQLGNSWITEEPNKVDGYNLVALASVRLNKESAATQAFRKALDVDPSNIPSLMYFASQDMANNNPQKASAALATLLDSNPDYVPALIMNYRAMKSLGNTKQALNRIATASEGSDKDPRLTLLLAKANYSEGNYNEALKVLDNYEPQKGQSQRNYWLIKVNSYTKLNQNKRALESVRQWTLAEPKSEVAWLRKVEFEESVHLNNDALTSAKNGLIHLPESVRLRLIEANLLVSFNRSKDAQKSLNKLDKATRELPFAQKVQGNIYALDGNYIDALPLLLNGYQTAPALRNASLVYLTYKSLGRRDDGIDFLETHLAQSERDTGTRLLVANEYLSFDTNKAKSHYLKVIDIEPRTPLALNNLAYLYTEEQNFNKADEYASKAVELVPNSPQILDTAATVKLALGDKKSAVSLLEKAHSLAPDDKGIKANLDKAKSTI